MAEEEKKEDTTPKKSTKTPMPKRCAIERQRFLEKAMPMDMVFMPSGSMLENGHVNGEIKPLGMLPCGVKLNSTSSFGWHGHGKIHVTVDGVLIAVQVSTSATAVNSKSAKD